MMKLDVKIDSFRKEKCRYSDAPLGPPILELGTMPLANSFLQKNQLQDEEFVCPLSLTWCPESKLLQLSHVVPAEIMFSNYLYVSSTTKTFQKHFSEYAKSIRKKMPNRINPLAVDIGSNDGLLVSCFKQEGFNGIGVDPAKNLSDQANAKGIETINRFFDEACVDYIVQKYGKADVITANNVFAHIDDVQSVCRNVNRLLKDDGMFVIEFPYLVTMFEEMLFDMIYHEHLSYISVIALEFLLRRFDLEIFSIEQVASHGGSLRACIQKKNGPWSIGPEVSQMRDAEIKKGYREKNVYLDFAKRVEQTRKELIGFVDDVKKNRQSIAGYGAPAKANTIIHYCHFSASQIDYIIDDNPLKQNTFSPGAKIPIVPSRYLEDHPVDYVIIFAWNFAREIMEKLQHLKKRGVRFIIPLPTPRIL